MTTTRTLRTPHAVAAYIAGIVTANLTVAHFGPAVIPLNAFVLIGLDLTLRDYLHDAWHRHRVRNLALLIAAGGGISYALNPAVGQIAAASTIAFSLAAIADSLAYHAARRWRWAARANVSNVVGAAVDSIVFPTLAFGVLIWPIIVAQFVAKVAGGAVWSILLYPFVRRAAAHHN